VLSLSPIWLLPAALPALHAAGLERLVVFSSTSRFTKSASPDAAEREVARHLAGAEAAVTAFCEGRGVRWTILRPTLIYAEGQDANVSRLAALIRRFGVLPLYGRGDGRRQPVHADDLAAAALAALDGPAAANRAFDLPGGETLTYRAMCERIFAGLGRRPRILSLPPPLWRAGFALAAPLLPGAGAAMGARMAEDLVFDAAPARRALRWSPRPFHPVSTRADASGAG
jgi:nucleoside-diphosphate-sugar epimerase